MWQQIKSAPATALLCVLWVLVFALMAYTQGSVQVGRDWLSGGIGSDISNEYGHLTCAQLLQGQLWRPLTATFIHYSLIHLGMNLIGLWLLGALLESWYGSAQLLGLYVVIGFFGNALAILGRLLVAELLHGRITIVDHPSGGGSSVICGMVALLAVAGWRMRSRFGSFLRRQMVLVLVLTALMGVFIKNIDNFGHAGGAIVGAVIGLAHSWLERNAERHRLRWVGTLALFVLAAAFAGQFRADQVQARTARVQEQQLKQEVQVQGETLVRLLRLRACYLDLSRRGPSRAVPLDLAGLRVVGLPTAPAARSVARGRDRPARAPGRSRYGRDPRGVLACPEPGRPGRRPGPDAR